MHPFPRNFCSVSHLVVPAEQKRAGCPISCEFKPDANGAPPPTSSISSKPAVTQAQAPPNCVFLLFSNPPPSSLSYVPVPIVHASNIPTPPHCSFPSLGATLRGVSSYRSAAAVPTPHLQGNLNFQTCTIIIPLPTKCILSVLT